MKIKSLMVGALMILVVASCSGAASAPSASPAPSVSPLERVLLDTARNQHDLNDVVDMGASRAYSDLAFQAMVASMDSAVKGAQDDLEWVKTADLPTALKTPLAEMFTRMTSTSNYWHDETIDSRYRFILTPPLASGLLPQLADIRQIALTFVH